MTPRKTQQGASANARTGSVKRGARDASSARTPKPATRKPSASASAAKRPAPAGNRTKRPATWWRWWLLPIIVVGTVAIFVVAYYPVAKVQYRETRGRDKLQAELVTLQARNGRLATQVARLKTPEGVEDYARSQLGMVKHGENVVIVVDGSKPAPALVASATAMARLDSDEATIPPAGPWTAFLDSVFGFR